MLVTATNHFASMPARIKLHTWGERLWSRGDIQQLLEWLPEHIELTESDLLNESKHQPHYVRDSRLAFRTIILAALSLTLSFPLITGCQPIRHGASSATLEERVLGYENEPGYEAAFGQPSELAAPPNSLLASQRDIINAQAKHLRRVEVLVSAQVWRILPTDENNRGYRHQRFLIRLNNGTTILVANDVTMGEVVPVKLGDIVEIKGEYIWTKRGGVLHWTHHTDDQHPGGWIRLGASTYQ